MKFKFTNIRPTSPTGHGYTQPLAPKIFHFYILLFSIGNHIYWEKFMRKYQKLTIQSNFSQFYAPSSQRPKEPLFGRVGVISLRVVRFFIFDHNLDHFLWTSSSSTCLNSLQQDLDLF